MNEKRTKSLYAFNIKSVKDGFNANDVRDSGTSKNLVGQVVMGGGE